MPTAYLVVHLVALLILAAATVAASRHSRSLGLAWVGGVVVVGLGAQLVLVAWARPLATALAWPDLFFFQQGSVQLAVVILVAVPLLQKTRVAKLRGALLGACLLALAAYSSRAMLFAPSPLPGELVDAKPGQPVLVRQTETSTCAAAAAATLLRAVGVDSDASERDLAQLSFTHPTLGTQDLGLYRGLRLAAPQREVRFAQRTLRDLRAQAPCLIFVGLDRGRVPDDETYAFLRDRCNWNDGEVHAVVCFGFARDGEREVVVIGDPSYGVERWSLEHLGYLWDGSTVEVR